MIVHVSPFFWGTLILFILTAIFYIVCLSLLYYWHEKDTTYVVVPLMFTFEFFMAGFFVVAIVSLLIQYWPDILRLAGG
jgi:hypothetical protein